MFRILSYCVSGLIKGSMLGLRRGPHITRYYYYKRLSDKFPNVGADARVLSISHSNTLCTVLGLGGAQITEANYPEANMLALPFPDQTFDFVVSDQVLEHVEGEPQVAVSEGFRVLKPGGYAVHATCLMNPIHGAPGDFWRFTPDGLRLLCKKHAAITDFGGWGNPYAFAIMSLKMRYEGVPEARWHPYHWIAVANHPRLPVSTWVVAQKTQ